MSANFETALRYMKIIQLLNNHITAATELMAKIADGPEQIICFHLHSHLLYNPPVQTGEADPYQDMVNPANGIMNGPVIVIQSPISAGMMSPQQIKDLINGGKGNHGHFFSTKPQTIPAEFASEAFKLDVQLTASVLQVILDGYQKKKAEYVKKLAELNVNIIFPDATATTADISTSAG